MKPFRITLPWPPSTNDFMGERVIVPMEYCRLRAKGLGDAAIRKINRKFMPFVSKYLTARAREFREMVVAMVQKQFPGLEQSQDRLCFKLEVCAPTRRECDVSNFIKQVEDALQAAGVFANDSQIDDNRQVRGPIVPGGCVHVLIWKHEKQPDSQPALFPTEEKW